MLFSEFICLFYKCLLSPGIVIFTEQSVGDAVIAHSIVAYGKSTDLGSKDLRPLQQLVKAGTV